MIAWIAFLFALGGACFYLSGYQPFPEISRRFSYFVLISGAFLLISERGPGIQAQRCPQSLPLFSGHMVHYVDHGICLGLQKISLWVHLVVAF